MSRYLFIEAYSSNERWSVESDAQRVHKSVFVCRHPLSKVIEGELCLKNRSV